METQKNVFIILPSPINCPTCSKGKLIPYIHYIQYPRETGEYLPVVRYQCSNCKSIKIFKSEEHTDPR